MKGKRNNAYESGNTIKHPGKGIGAKFWNNEKK
jgi:hypothetical protein